VALGRLVDETPRAGGLLPGGLLPGGAVRSILAAIARERLLADGDRGEGAFELVELALQLAQRLCKVAVHRLSLAIEARR
jgi:hypothetical protein